MKPVVRCVRYSILLAGLLMASVGGTATTTGETAVYNRALGPVLDSAARLRWVRAIGTDQVAQLAAMIERYDARQLLDITASNGKTALMVASKQGDLQLVKTLSDAGARINATTVTNGTALMFAVLGNRQSVAHWLFERGADIHVIGSNGWSAVMIAAAKGHLAMLRWLVAEGADTQVRDVYRFTAMMRAVENGHLDVASFLLSLPGAQVNARDEYGNTSLHHAVSAVDVQMVELLLAHGADPDLQNRSGHSARDLAADDSPMKSLLK
ncbi:MAG: hypothetical protein HKN42_12940 [Granulosicoccus sp.]|nr:hypothetical protein [Granulosicoccus sp.]